MGFKPGGIVLPFNLFQMCKVSVKASPIVFFHGILPHSLQEQKDIIQPLLMLARKAIMNKWFEIAIPYIREGYP